LGRLNQALPIIAIISFIAKGFFGQSWPLRGFTGGISFNETQ
jgi:hypothetical protein